MKPYLNDIISEQKFSCWLYRDNAGLDHACDERRMNFMKNVIETIH